MYIPFADFVRLDIALGVVAILAWATCAAMAVLRRRAFRQRADMWWVLAYLCLLAVGVARVWNASVWWSIHPETWPTVDHLTPLGAPMTMREAGVIAWADLSVNGLLAAAAVLAVFASVRRRDAFDV